MKRFLALVAGMGFGLTLLWNVASWLGIGDQSGPPFVLAAGVFVVWIPAVKYMQQLGVAGRADWKMATLGAPQWMGWLRNACFGYAFASMALGFLMGNANNHAASIGRMGAPVLMVFYAAALGVLYSAALLQEDGLEWRCERGHDVHAGAKYCEECGAPVPDIESRLKST